MATLSKALQAVKTAASAIGQGIQSGINLAVSQGNRLVELSKLIVLAVKPEEYHAVVVGSVREWMIDGLEPKYRDAMRAETLTQEQSLKEGAWIRSRVSAYNSKSGAMVEKKAREEFETRAAVMDKHRAVMAVRKPVNDNLNKSITRLLAHLKLDKDGNAIVPAEKGNAGEGGRTRSASAMTAVEKASESIKKIEEASSTPAYAKPFVDRVATLLVRTRVAMQDLDKVMKGGKETAEQITANYAAAKMAKQTPSDSNIPAALQRTPNPPLDQAQLSTIAAIVAEALKSKQA